MTIIATIEARMNSSRLPGKVFLQSKGIPLLGHLVNRLKQVKILDGIVLATTINQEDDVLVDFANENKINFFRGSEEDVMGRVLKAGEANKAEIIVEITGDCPLIDPNIVDQVITTFLNNDCDFVNNNSVLTYPDGMDTRVFSLKALQKSYSLTKDKLDYEHVTLHMKKNPKLFKIINLIAPKNLYWPELGLTLDEKLDYIFINKIIEYLYDKNPFFNLYEIIELLKNKPELLSINNKVKRKGDN